MLFGLKKVLVTQNFLKYWVTYPNIWFLLHFYVTFFHPKFKILNEKKLKNEVFKKVQF